MSLAALPNAAASDEETPTMVPTDATPDLTTGAPPLATPDELTTDRPTGPVTSTSTEGPPTDLDEISKAVPTEFPTGSSSTDRLPQTDHSPDITELAGRVAGIAIALTIVIVAVIAMAAVAVITVVLRKKKMLYFIKPRSTLAKNGLSTESTVGKL